MKKASCVVVICVLVLFTSQVWANELLVLSDEKSQTSQKWQDEVFLEYAGSEMGKKLPAKIVTVQGTNFPQWLTEAMQEGRVGEIVGTPTFLIWDAENKKEVGRVEGYTQKPRFYSQLKEALAMIDQGGHPGRREGSAGHTEQEGSGGEQRQEGSGGMSQDIMDHMYKTPEEAKRVSEMLGLGGEIHSHETPDGTIYMPGNMM